MGAVIIYILHRGWLHACSMSGGVVNELLGAPAHPWGLISSHHAVLAHLRAAVCTDCSTSIFSGQPPHSGRPANVASATPRTCSVACNGKQSAEHYSTGENLPQGKTWPLT